MTLRALLRPADSLGARHVHAGSCLCEECSRSTCSPMNNTVTLDQSVKSGLPFDFTLDNGTELECRSGLCTPAIVPDPESLCVGLARLELATRTRKRQLLEAHGAGSMPEDAEPLSDWLLRYKDQLRGEDLAAEGRSLLASAPRGRGPILPNPISFTAQEPPPPFDPDLNAQIQAGKVAPSPPTGTEDAGAPNASAPDAGNSSALPCHLHHAMQQVHAVALSNDMACSSMAAASPGPRPRVAKRQVRMCAARRGLAEDQEMAVELHAAKLQSVRLPDIPGNGMLAYDRGYASLLAGAPMTAARPAFDYLTCARMCVSTESCWAWTALAGACQAACMT